MLSPLGKWRTGDIDKIKIDVKIYKFQGYIITLPGILPRFDSNPSDGGFSDMQSYYRIGNENMGNLKKIKKIVC